MFAYLINVGCRNRNLRLVQYFNAHFLTAIENPFVLFVQNYTILGNVLHMLIIEEAIK